MVSRKPKEENVLRRKWCSETLCQVFLKVQENEDREMTVGFSIMEIHGDFDAAVFSNMLGTETLFKWVKV